MKKIILVITTALSCMAVSLQASGCKSDTTVSRHASLKGKRLVNAEQNMQGLPNFNLGYAYHFDTLGIGVGFMIYGIQRIPIREMALVTYLAAGPTIEYLIKKRTQSLWNRSSVGSRFAFGKIPQGSGSSAIQIMPYVNIAYHFPSSNASYLGFDFKVLYLIFPPLKGERAQFRPRPEDKWDVAVGFFFNY